MILSKSCYPVPWTVSRTVPLGPKNGGLEGYIISEKVGTACKFYQYIIKIIIILFIPTLLWFSGVYIDFSPETDILTHFGLKNRGLGAIEL